MDSCNFASLLAEVSHDKAKWNERRETSAGFQRVSYHACAHVSLTTSDVFVTCDTTQRTGLKLSASSSGCWIGTRAQILNEPIRVEDETTLRVSTVADLITSLCLARRGKPKRRILRQIFRSLIAEAHVFGVKFIWLYEIVGFIAIRGFSFWAESDLWSDVWPAMDGLVSLLAEVSHDETKSSPSGDTQSYRIN